MIRRATLFCDEGASKAFEGAKFAKTALSQPFTSPTVSANLFHQLVLICSRHHTQM